MPMCNEAMHVTRYDLGREQEIAAKDARIALLAKRMQDIYRNK